mgnify:CR=1 FL=1
MTKIEKPWGYEIHWAETDNYVGKLLFINAGPGEIHRFAADSCSVEVIEVSTPHLDDVVRLEDDYSRE